MIVRAEDQGGLIDAIDVLDPNPASYPSTQDWLNAVANLDGKTVFLEGDAAAGMSLQVLGIGFGVTYSAQIQGSVMPVIVNVNPGDIPGVQADNYLQFVGLDLRQLIFTGAKELGPVTVGVNLRQINGSSFITTVNIFDDPDIDLDSITTDGESDVSGTSIDLGAVAPLAPTFNVGIMIKDANEPDLNGITMERSIRAGAALDLPFIMVAADYDISVPEDSSGEESKSWALGAELDLPVLDLRIGMSSSGMDGASTLIHLGLGLTILDVGIAYADEGDTYIAGVNLSLGF